jgi:hypothetical protein
MGADSPTDVMQSDRGAAPERSRCSTSQLTADGYILSRVLHDWANTEAEAILQSVRRSAPKHAELLVLESILPEDSEPHHAKVLDIIMLAISGGRERTRREYQTLLERGGLRLDRVVPTTGPVSVIVGAPT